MKKKIFIVLALFFLAVSFLLVRAQIKVDYPEGFAKDMDLDGLTDEGEKQIFKTDPGSSDSDGDGYLDGLEILNGTDPLDAASYLDVKPVSAVFEPSWPWYMTRISALISFILLYVVIFLGLSIRLPVLNRIVPLGKSLEIHAWLSVQAFLFALAHGTALLFDKFLEFNIASVFIPFASEFQPVMVGFGTVVFYLIFLLIVTSYFRHKMPHWLWRASHFLNIPLYIMAVIHGGAIGTDLSKSGVLRDVFIFANVVLAVLFVNNILYQIYTVIKRRKERKEKAIAQSFIQ